MGLGALRRALAAWLIARYQGRDPDLVIGGQARPYLWGAPHRVELLTVADFVATQPDNATPLTCWTLFITGPRCRHWGFHCPERGWVHWKLFTAADDPGDIGKGCDA